jgi:2,4-dienoyl-CoA reductase (NADPH2)
MAATRFKKLFEPVKVGRIILKNRIIMTSMTVGAGYAKEGRPTQRMLNLVAEIAKGGAGMLCTSIAFFPRKDGCIPYGTDDKFTPFLREIAETAHKYDTPITGQLTTIQEWRKDNDSPLEIVGPSAIRVRPKSPMPRALSVDEIHILINQYAEAARRVREAGFDAVEILAGVGAIINRFMSPATNKREDEYGGSLENRIRLAREVIGAVKQKAGEDFTVLWRWSPVEFVSGGYDLEGAKQIAPVLEMAGVHWLNCQVGWHDSLIPLTTKEIPDGHWAYLAEGIKRTVKIPVVTAYRITDPVVAERILERGQADIIGMCRSLIADPEWPNKVRERRFNEIRRCVCCMRCIDDVVGNGKPLEYCSVNPRLGEDLESIVQRAVIPKKVLVAGGGPAGMQAAMIAAVRGHSVTLYETGPRLGGAILLSSVFNPLFERLIKHLKDQLEKHNVEIRLGRAVTPELIREIKPDVIVLAVGGKPRTLKVPGIDRKNVVSLSDVIQFIGGRTPWHGEVGRGVIWRIGFFFLRYIYNPALIRWFLRFKFFFGKRVVIIGGGLPGCELAEALVERGRMVTILEESRRMGVDIGASRRHLVLGKLRESGARMENEVMVSAITEKGVTAKRTDSTEFSVDVDTVAVTLGVEENLGLVQQLGGKVPALYVIGDCANPGHMPEATKAGYRVGRDL